MFFCPFSQGDPSLPYGEGQPVGVNGEGTTGRLKEGELWSKQGYTACKTTTAIGEAMSVECNGKLSNM